LPKNPEKLLFYSKFWGLSRAHKIASTPTSDLYRVSFAHKEAVLKIFKDRGKGSEAKGALALQCFSGHGAVHLLRADEDAHLLEWVDGNPLKTLVEGGRDGEATDIICQVISALHSYGGPLPEGLNDLHGYFQSLFTKARQNEADPLYGEAAKMAEDLLQNEQEIRLLHGDIHHENILHSSDRGWLALDPKAVYGERTYDVANTFYNPIGFESQARSTDVILGRSRVFSEKLKLDRKRILQFAFVHGALSAVWHGEDGEQEKDSLEIAAAIQSVLKSI
jgi:streptomycin 6-kinase